MLAFPVSEKKVKALRDRFVALRCVESDLQERFVGKTSVELLHVPTGIRIRSSGRGSQSLNRFLARRSLADELEARSQNKTRHTVKAEKLREQKGRANRRQAHEDRFSQFSLRPFSEQPVCSPEMEKRLKQLQQFKQEENR